MTSSTVIPASGQTLPAERFRPNPWGWLMIAFLSPSALLMAGVSISLLMEPKSAIWTSNALLSICSVVNASWMLCLALCMAALAVRLLTEEIRVTDDTLSWRTWRGTKTVPWNDILDYYDAVQFGLHILEASPQAEADQTPSAYKRTHLGVIVTAQEQCRFSPSWPHAAMLRARVMERATNVHTREWTLLGARPDRDWPRTFAYRTPWSDIGAVAFVFLLVGTVIARTAHPMAAFIQGVQADMSQFWADLFLGMIASAGLIVVGLIVFVVRSFAEAGRRRTQSITLTSEGIIYADPIRRSEARWNEIRALRITRQGYGYAIETEHGTFDFSASIRDKAILMAGIAAQSRVFVPAGWQEAASDPPLANGRLFSYRTSNNRAYLVMATVSAFPLSYFSYQLVEGLKEFPESAGGTIFTVLSFAVYVTASVLTIWGWWSFIVAGVQTDDEGITQRTPLKTKRIVWTDVRHIEIRGAESFTVITIYGAHERIRYSALIANGEQLVAEIQRHTGKDLGLP